MKKTTLKKRNGMFDSVVYPISSVLNLNGQSDRRPPLPDSHAL